MSTRNPEIIELRSSAEKLGITFPGYARIKDVPLPQLRRAVREALAVKRREDEVRRQAEEAAAWQSRDAALVTSVDALMKRVGSALKRSDAAKKGAETRRKNVIKAACEKRAVEKMLSGAEPCTLGALLREAYAAAAK